MFYKIKFHFQIAWKSLWILSCWSYYYKLIRERCRCLERLMRCLKKDGKWLMSHAPTAMALPWQNQKNKSRSSIAPNKINNIPLSLNSSLLMNLIRTNSKRKKINKNSFRRSPRKWRNKKNNKQPSTTRFKTNNMLMINFTWIKRKLMLWKEQMMCQKRLEKNFCKDGQCWIKVAMVIFH